MKLICDTQTALNIVSNPVFHETNKQLKSDGIFLEHRNSAHVKYKLVVADCCN